MRHPACHFSISILTRGKTASAIARAAYIGRCRFHDERTGLTYSYRQRGGLLAEGTVNWTLGPERLWNEVERAEVRKNARVAREIKVALPAELPPGEMRRVLHGYCCHLKDRYGLAAQWVIHAPKFLDRADGRSIEEKYRAGTIDQDEYFRILSDPKRTNLNFHAHILMSTRRRDPETGEFAEKIRCIDHVKTGPEEIQAMRREWESRANSALCRSEAQRRVDLRSNKALEAAGLAPKGLVAQPHVGPKGSHDTADKYPDRVKARAEIQEHNEDRWTVWLQRRALERERARLQDSARIVAQAEAERKREAAEEKRKIASAKNEDEARHAAVEAVHLYSPRGTLADIIARVQGGEQMEMPPGEDSKIDPETYVSETSKTPFNKALKVKRKAPVRVRTR